MDNKIALEEHFAISETLGNSQEYIYPEKWQEVQKSIEDVGDHRLRLMDAAGIEMALVSLNAPAIQCIPDTKQAIETAKRANDALAEKVEKNRDRFRGFAALPMQDPEAAAEEATRCIKELGFIGALVNGFTQIQNEESAVYLDETRYNDFWSTFASLGCPFYLHPRNPLPSRSLAYKDHPWLLGSAWAFGVETATHALRLMGAGLFDKHPDLQIILGHLGEGLPALIWRVDHRVANEPRGYSCKKSFQHYFFNNFHVTTSGNFRTSSLQVTMQELGVDRIMFSTDFPFEEMHWASEWFDSTSISENDRIKIGRNNAAKLFNLDLD
ncbi:amidohydrolase family protein [Salmonella enterica]